jgi:hypothetical protein
MRNAIGWTLAAGMSVFAFTAAAIPPAHAADMGVPDYGYQQQPQGYYPPQQGYYPQPQQAEVYAPPPPPPAAYGYPPPPPPPVAYYPYAPAPVVVGPYYGRGYYWHGYGPRFAYGYGRGYGWGHYRHW